MVPLYHFRTSRPRVMKYPVPGNPPALGLVGRIQLLTELRHRVMT
jgi:hypothetical protein